MKRLAMIFATALVALSTVQVSAQENLDPECIKYLSYYKEYYKQKSYDQALPSWRKAFAICPTNTRETVYTEGAALYRYLINKNRNNEIAKEAYVDTLLMLHDMRAANYPKSAVTALNNKGLDMINYIQDDDKAIYEGCNAIIENNGAKTKPQIFLFALNASVALYQLGTNDAEQVINDYETYISDLEQIVAASEKTVASTPTDANKKALEANIKLKTDVENIFIASKVASCENLVELFEPRLAADPTNYDLATKIVKMLGTTDGGTSTELFLNAVTVMHNTNPNYVSAYNLYKLNSSRGDYATAVSFIEQAIAFEESDATTDGQYYYELAAYAIKNGKTAKAYEAALKAAELNAAYAGKCYMICATAWGAQTCGGDEISKRAPYWVAVDYLNKAKAADASLADEANGLISQYAKYYPQTADAFMYGYTDGQSYTVACGGMRATTTVRTQK